MARMAMETGRRPVLRRHMDPSERQAGVLGLFGAFCFVVVAIYVRLIGRADLDTSLQAALRAAAEWVDPFGSYWVEAAARDLAPAGGPTMIGLVVAVAVVHVALTRGWGGAALVLAALGGGVLLGVLLKIGFGRSGVPISLHWLPLFGASFPSAGALVPAIVYPTLGAVLAVTYGGGLVGAFLIGCSALAALLIGLSRAVLGVHLPTDVLAGWSAGLAWASLCWIVMRRTRGWGRL